MNEDIKRVLAWVLIYSDAPSDVRECALEAYREAMSPAKATVETLPLSFWRGLEGMEFIPRIKAVRFAVPGAGLKEAKDAVEARFGDTGRGYWRGW